MIENTRANRIPQYFADLGLVLLSIFSGFGTGLIVGVLGSFIYLVIAVPLIVGFINGRGLTENAKYTKTRNRHILVISSLLMTIFMYGTFHYTRYRMDEVITALHLTDGLSDTGLKTARAITDYALEQETGRSGFAGYMLFRAKSGVSIGRIFSSNRLNLGPIFTWLYWLVELGIIGFFTVSAATSLARKPFCEFCNSWFPEPRHIGGVPKSQENEILELVRSNDFAGVGKTLKESADLPSVEFYLQSCKSCNRNDSFLTIANASLLNQKLVSIQTQKIVLPPRQKILLAEEIRYLKIGNKKTSKLQPN